MRALLLTSVLFASSVALAEPLPRCEASTADAGVTHDTLSATRLLRRVVISLTGRPPSSEALEAILKTPVEGREAVISKAIEDAMSSTSFYTTMLTFAHDWIPVGAYSVGTGDAWQGDMAGHIKSCGGNTLYPGAWFFADQQALCADPAAEKHTIEPWFAPGAPVLVLGPAGSAVTSYVDTKGVTVDCGFAYGGYYDPALAAGCGCGPNLVYCYPNGGLSAAPTSDPRFQPRQIYEEPARLLAHLAWYDRPLSDLVVGNYSVAPNMLRSLYVRMGRMSGSSASDSNTTWWKPATDTSPRDPEHTAPNDPTAWREFVVESLNPYMLSLTGGTPSGDLSRKYEFDPRTTTDPPKGIPAAGVLTMMGSYGSFARERVRAARFLETFACANFAPPAVDQIFPPYAGDPAVSGTCMHCHRTLDPAAIFFRRWDYSPHLSYYVPWPFMPGIGNERITAEQLTGNYPFSSGPWPRWRDAFKPGTVMTPVTPAQVAANPEAIMLDTMPSDGSYTLLGQHGDGTMGPLGFGKILVTSGEFDRCAVRRMFEKFVGRPLDPAAEVRYIDALAAQFRDKNGRKLKPFVRYLMSLPEFRRGL